MKSFTPSQRSREWQLTNLAAGLCMYCAEPRALTLSGKLGVLCLKHQAKNRAKWRRKHGPRDLSNLLSLDCYDLVDPIALSYAAALIESEGHLWVGTFRGKTGRCALYPAIIIRMVEDEPLQYMAKVFGGHVTFRPSKKSNHRGIFSYQACGRMGGAICHAILPYLKVNRKIKWALLMIELADLVGRYSYQDVQRNPELKSMIDGLSQRVADLRKSHANL